jgi:two-component system chemotaxis response regulator CheY
MKALVIDDSRAMRAMLKGMLKTAGFADVAEAGNGQEGLAAAHPELSLILVDWNMPVMDGLAFVKAIRARSDCASVPLMMVTTETELSRVGDALDAGANEYLMKPFTAEALTEKLELLGIFSA